jgi:FkbM family methyltransferase
MSWIPPESIEEKFKRLIIPPAWYIKYLYRKELAGGEREIHLIPTLARGDKVSLDIGANKGVYSYALLGHSSAVHAFEPNPKAFRILKSWAERRVILHPLALGDITGKATLIIPKSGKGYSNQGGSLHQAKTGKQHGAVSVDTTRLDELGIRNIGFMKIDVEGFESNVLKGATEILRNDRPNLLIEIEERHTGRGMAEMVKEICDYGYRCLALCDGTLTPFDRIKPDRYHSEAGIPAGYIFNFIFLPV